MLARIEVEGEERVRQAYQQGRGVLFFTGHFGYWEMQAIAHPLHCRADFGAGPSARQSRTCTTMLERIRTVTGNAVIYRQGAIRKSAARAGRRIAASRILIDQHSALARRGLRGLLPPPCGDDLGAGGAGAAHRRAGDPGVRVAASRRPLPVHLRASGRAAAATDSPDAVREFTQRCTDVLEMYVRRDPELWLWMHRRWRDRDLRLAGEAAGSDDAVTAATE